MQATMKHSKKITISPFDKILVVILLIETILLAGVIGYQLGEANAYMQPVYNFTLQMDSGTIEH